MVGLAGCYLTIRFIRFPFVSIGLMLIVAAFRLGGFGASIMSLAFGLLITNLWIAGIRPIGLDPHLNTHGTLLDLRPSSGRCRQASVKDRRMERRQDSPRAAVVRRDHYDVTGRVRHQDGRWVWTHVAVSLTRDEDGSPLHFIAQIESLEARQLAEQNLVAHCGFNRGRERHGDRVPRCQPGSCPRP